MVAFCCTGLADSGIMPPMKYWDLIAAGWSWGYCSARDSIGDTVAARLKMPSRVLGCSLG